MAIKVKVKPIWRASTTTDVDFDSVFVRQFTDFANISPPNPPDTGAIRLFSDATDGRLKVKKADGTVVKLETPDWTLIENKPTLIERRRGQFQQFSIEGCQTGTGVNVTGFAITAQGTPLVIIVSDTRIAGVQTAATAGSVAARYSNALIRPVLISLLTGSIVAVETTNVRAFVGLASGSVGTIVGSDTAADSAHVIGFLKRSTDTSWQFVVNNGSGTATYVNTGIAYTANTPVYWTLRRMGPNQWTWQIQMGANQASGSTSSGPSETTDGVFYMAAVGTTEAVAKTVAHPWCYGELVPAF